VNLNLQSGRDERFHRIYTAVSPMTQDKVILHLYDLSASSDRQPEKKARREFDVLHKLQRHSWAPRILDSFQDAPGYPGEMRFFTLVDPVAPDLAERLKDRTWTVQQRVAFASAALTALKELHSTAVDEEGIVHRSISPRTIKVKHDDSPVLTGFQLAKVPADISVSSGVELSEHVRETVAPEVIQSGLVAADQRSDVYALCASLVRVFEDITDESATGALDALALGVAADPDKRAGLDDIISDFGYLQRTTDTQRHPPPARYWSENLIVDIHGRSYRVVARLGSGGIGTTFKVVEVDPLSGQDRGPFVAKAVHDRQDGHRVLDAYGLARPHLGRHPCLSAIFEVAKDWSDNGIIALMNWIEGVPLAEFAGLLPELAGELQEDNPDRLAIRWLKELCGIWL